MPTYRISMRKFFDVTVSANNEERALDEAYVRIADDDFHLDWRDADVVNVEEIKPMEMEEYLSLSTYILCPQCRSFSVAENGQVSVQGRQVHQSRHCRDCDHRWTDIYTLSGWK